MKTLLAVAVLLSIPYSSQADSPASGLEALAPGAWLGYEVVLQPGLPAPCCFRRENGRVEDVACRLDRDDWNFGHRDDAVVPADVRLHVLVRRAGEGFDRVHAVGTHCAIDAAGAHVEKLGEVSTEASIALLEGVLAKGSKRTRQHALPVIAYHAGSAADAALERASAPGAGKALRRDAVFWLATARGARGWRHVRSLLEGERDAALRRHMVFAISVSQDPAARDALRALVADVDRRVAAEALFWLAQDEDPESEALARAMLARDADRGVHDKVVFALSQLPSERAIPALQDLVRDVVPKEIRKRALFWLAQVDDDAVLPLFDELLGGGN